MRRQATYAGREEADQPNEPDAYWRFSELYSCVDNDCGGGWNLIILLKGGYCYAT